MKKGVPNQGLSKQRLSNRGTEKSFSLNTTDLFFSHDEPSSTHEVIQEYVPKTLSEYMGQTILKERIAVCIRSAKERNRCLDHLLLFGPPGLGKTTFAKVISNEMKAPVRITNGPTLQKTGDLVALLTQLKANTILFIDEIHRIPRNIEEILYGAMEQYTIDIIIGKNAAAKIVSLPIAPFTLIGATTRISLLSSPLRTRFGITEKFDFYSPEALQSIILQSAEFYSLTFLPDAAYTLALSSRGTPRIAKKLVRRIRDYVLAHGITVITAPVVKEACTFLGIYKFGLTEVDRTLLTILLKREGTPIGIETLAALIGEDPETIEEVYEPFLLQKGFIERTPRGRIISPTGKEEVEVAF